MIFGGFPSCKLLLANGSKPPHIHQIPMLIVARASALYTVVRLLCTLCPYEKAKPRVHAKLYQTNYILYKVLERKLCMLCLANEGISKECRYADNVNWDCLVKFSFSIGKFNSESLRTQEYFLYICQ